MTDINKLKALAEAATPQNFDTAEAVSEGGWIECPSCGGEGHIDLGNDYCNYDSCALGVQFYGIGDEHVMAEAYYRAANPAAVLELIAEVERLNSELTKARKLLQMLFDTYGYGLRAIDHAEVNAYLAHQSAPACTHEWDINEQGTAITCSNCGARSSDDALTAKGGSDE